MDYDFSEWILLESRRVGLEPLDLKLFSELLFVSEQHPNLLQYSPSVFGSEKNLKAYFTAAFQAKNEKNRYPFAIFDKTIGRYVGSTSFGAISNKNQRIEIGWTWIDKSVQRTGLNRHCKFLLLKYAFEKLEFERVELKTDSRNMQSRKAILGIGATYEGELRSHTLMSDGYRRNTVYYSILSSEWPEVRERIFKNFE